MWDLRPIDLNKDLVRMDCLKINKKFDKKIKKSLTKDSHYKVITFTKCSNKVQLTKFKKIYR